ncbi:helix-turn-helix domain-containing protein [Pragia fontium]|uniref:HTH cro/C1-type domain-containing protein n=1 Tax=Pragia fontium DSM 5563 = ATCC 49100 TaxID=1122977 RepID=A0AAJ4W9K1_9GAMM|nr:helix-turn-helix domain-containing protein [Pragia fontium]SFC48690.1 hypothetical protein SAMN02745723_102486 [Pragia fontium DSM 5563 = ATCC 49100]
MIYIGLKLKELRELEEITVCELSNITGIDPNTISNYEDNQSVEVSAKTLTQITQHSKFKKFTLWLMTGEISPEIGQISPALSPDGHALMSNPQPPRAAG